jgi:hypothetical protein
VRKLPPWAPLAEKKKGDPDFAKRKEMTAVLEPMIPEFSVRLGGATCIDVTQHCIDEAYGLWYSERMIQAIIACLQ